MVSQPEDVQEVQRCLTAYAPWARLTPERRCDPS
jgi:hypothetical protein